MLRQLHVRVDIASANARERASTQTQRQRAYKKSTIVEISCRSNPASTVVLLLVCKAAPTASRLNVGGGDEALLASAGPSDGHQDTGLIEAVVDKRRLS